VRVVEGGVAEGSRRRTLSHTHPTRCLPPPPPPPADIDEYVHLQLLAAAVDITAAVLRPGGCFIAKIFAAGNAPLLRAQLRALFRRVDISKPASSRAHSFEAFIVCQGFAPPAGFVPRLLRPQPPGTGAGEAAGPLPGGGSGGGGEGDAVGSETLLRFLSMGDVGDGGSGGVGEAADAVPVG
jgi:hypothetical protein